MNIDDRRPLIQFSKICTFCRHLQDVVDRRCAAFPQGIPAEIWEGRNDHTEPYAGDNGIQFERKPAQQEG